MLGRFIAKCKGLILPEGGFGSDVGGIKPIFFDVGNNERKMVEALKHCRKHLGDNATILYDNQIPDSIENMIKEQGKEAGGPWDCCHIFDFYGWEAKRVVVVTGGIHIMELITRARTHLSLILVYKGDEHDYAKTKEFF